MSSGIGDTLVNAICDSVYVYAMCEKVPVRTQRMGQTPWILSYICLHSPWCRFWELNSDPLQELQVLLTAEPSPAADLSLWLRTKATNDALLLWLPIAFNLLKLFIKPLREIRCAFLLWEGKGREGRGGKGREGEVREEEEREKRMCSCFMRQLLLLHS